MEKLRVATATAREGYEAAAGRLETRRARLRECDTEIASESAGPPLCRSVCVAWGFKNALEGRVSNGLDAKSFPHVVWCRP